ncbi:MAG: sigma-54-dependent Fis family transcriptional regulator [Oligoflexia bacterium]|nr:sigma-54-dependent Fis family transcriptional regulator [Oligoflexia bacterium]
MNDQSINKSSSNSIRNINMSEQQLKGLFLNILLIEDEKLHYISLEDKIKKHLELLNVPFKIDIAPSAELATKYLDQNKYELVFFDIDLDGEPVGLSLLKKYSKLITYPVVLTSHESEKFIKTANESGCRDYLLKPFREKNVPFLMNRFFTYLNEENDRKLILSCYLTQDKNTIKQLMQIPNLRVNLNPIYIIGPTGCGKQVVAEIVHEMLIGSSKGKFVELNCSSITETLAESTFFGHKKGSFTNASGDKKGLFEMANGGTLFLDEIGKMPLNLQDYLLKVIEQKKFRPVGSEVDIKTEFVLITAGCEELDQLIKEGKFRPDLKERLTGTVLRLPPLSERVDDIPFLLQQFIRSHPSGRLISISEQAMEFLKAYWWPGNVRELKLLVDRWQAQGINLLTIEEIKELKSKELSDQFSYINNDLFNDVYTHGLEEILEKINNRIINHVFLQNNMKARTTMNKLKISSRKFYKYLEKKDGIDESEDNTEE